MSRAEKDSEFQQIMTAAKEQSWSLEQTAKGHWRFVPPQRHQAACVFSGSPGDWRALRNFIAQMRRSGFVAPRRHGGGR